MGVPPVPGDDSIILEQGPQEIPRTEITTNIFTGLYNLFICVLKMEVKTVQDSK